jgi:fructokinase
MKARKRRIFGIGEILLDIIFREDKPVAAKPGGSVFNAMVSLARTGEEVHFISELGNDQTGELIARFMESNGMTTQHLKRYPTGNSPLAMAFLNHNNDATYDFYKNYPPSRSLGSLPHFSEDDLLLFGSFYAINSEVAHLVTEMVTNARQQGALVLYDPNIRKNHSNTPDLLKKTTENMALAHVVRGSDEDFTNLLNLTDPHAVYQQVKNDCPHLIITQNAKGVDLFSTSYVEHFETPPLKPVSTIGAGDNFNAGVLKAFINLDVRVNNLSTLNKSEWHKIINHGQAYAREACLTLDNYVPQGFSIVL